MVFCCGENFIIEENVRCKKRKSPTYSVFALQRQGSGAAAGNNKTSGGQGKKNLLDHATVKLRPCNNFQNKTHNNWTTNGKSRRAADD